MMRASHAPQTDTAGAAIPLAHDATDHHSAEVPAVSVTPFSPDRTPDEWCALVDALEQRVEHFDPDADDVEPLADDLWNRVNEAEDMVRAGCAMHRMNVFGRLCSYSALVGYRLEKQPGGHSLSRRELNRVLALRLGFLPDPEVTR